MRKELFPHLVIFIACFCILTAALILRPASPGTSHLRLGKISIPDMCILRAATGVPCPGCGLSRSMVAAINGDLRRSLAFHRLGLLTLLYVFLQFVCRLGIFVIPRWRTSLIRYGKFLNKGIIVLAILFGVNWVATLISL
ncbi:DUF2752 domain-containing protein [bacterium]|nr:DUF2752 domain-containing protein [bacterium]